MRQFYRKKLNDLLGAAGDEEFVQLLWATHALQSEYSDKARAFIKLETIPEGAVTTDGLSKFFIQKWEIETLANELMTVPKVTQPKRGRFRNLRCDHFGSIIECVNRLKELENAEFKPEKMNQSIYIEMARIASQQFDWQRGFANKPQFFRNAFVYGQGECARYFEHTYGITMNRFSQIGFMLYVSLTNNPVVQNNDEWEKFGVNRDEMEKVLKLISQPFASASRTATQQRRGIFHTAYRPSILRQTPCLRFGEMGARVRAPLPELILERITSGVFYDIVDGGGAIRNDYGRRFEEYCFSYLSTTFPALSWSTETQYGKRSNKYDSPDLLCREDGQVKIAFECKSSRMSQKAKFGSDPMAARGFDDMIKAVFQLWRFFSHSRRNRSGYEVSENAVGVVLTLDNWLVLANTLQERVIREAREMADAKDMEILEIDRKPIVFVAIVELERILSSASEVTFKEALAVANSEKYSGWRIDTIHKDLLGQRVPQKREYAFASKQGQLLPWWGNWTAHK